MHKRVQQCEKILPTKLWICLRRTTTPEDSIARTILQSYGLHELQNPITSTIHRMTIRNFRLLQDHMRFRDQGSSFPSFPFDDCFHRFHWYLIYMHLQRVIKTYMKALTIAGILQYINTHLFHDVRSYMMAEGELTSASWYTSTWLFWNWGTTIRVAKCCVAKTKGEEELRRFNVSLPNFLFLFGSCV